MKLFLDQMFRSGVTETLRAKGHDVVRATDIGQSRADDQQILEYAIRETRILVTLDEHFGDWVLLPLSNHPGVIRLKVNPTTDQRVINILLPFLQQHLPDQFKDHLVILSEKRAKWILTA